MATRTLRRLVPRRISQLTLIAVATVLIVAAGVLSISQAPSASAQCYGCYGGYGGYGGYGYGGYGGYGGLSNSYYNNPYYGSYSPYYGYNGYYGGYNMGSYYPFQYNGYNNGAYQPYLYSGYGNTYGYYNGAYGASNPYLTNGSLLSNGYSGYGNSYGYNMPLTNYASSYGAPTTTTVTVGGAGYGAAGYLDTTGSYCNLSAGGGQVWVPSGASPASYGCAS